VRIFDETSQNLDGSGKIVLFGATINHAAVFSTDCSRSSW